MKPDKKELQGRLHTFTAHMDDNHPGWDTVMILDKVNQYYFMGTVQDAILLIRKSAPPAYYVRRSAERARAESPHAFIYEMRSYRDAAQAEGADLGVTYMELDMVPYEIVFRIREYFNMASLHAVYPDLQAVRCVKSAYELGRMEQSGRLHSRLLTQEVPALLKEGMSEAEFSAAIQFKMIELGYQGITRFHRFQTEMGTGQIGFGTNSLFPTSFDGPGGAHGYGAAVPIGGDPARRLKKGDLVFVDLGFGVDGYHSDKTQVYMFGGKPDAQTRRAHQACIDIQKSIASQLVPGAIPSQIYENTLRDFKEDTRENFMGFAGQCVRFLGHGVGLQIDEYPVIAPGFDEPLKENMVISLEPKKGVGGVGMVGAEDTYVVTPQGGRCITGGPTAILEV